MKLATLKQVKKVTELLEDLPAEHLQELLESGFISDLFNANIDEMRRKITRNDFRKICGLVAISAKFPIWKTIELGVGLKNENWMKISDWANDILGKPAFTVVTKEVKLDLVKVTVAELGFKNGARRDQIYTRGKEFGLELCPSELGPQLRLQYQDQPNGEWILIAMEPITDSDGDLDVFCVKRLDSGLWLHSDDGSADNFWNSDSQWVFVRPRN